jgi:TRAP-type mannitol/chloroaromatic compound transport system permease small subunit
MTESVPQAMQRDSQPSPARDTVQYAPEHEWPRLVHLSEALRKAVDRVGRFGAWMIVPLVLITVMDVSIRKVGLFQIMLIENFGRMFDSTVLQELEWHFHTGLFALVLGYGYIWNSHVRVDLVREHLHFRKKAWLEFLGLTFFLIPYMCIVVYFAVIYAHDSYMMNEISASTVGLTHRWIIKTVLVVGLCFVLVAGVSVLLQVMVVLWGPQDRRYPLMTLEWPEEQGTKIEGKERLDLAKAQDVLRARAAKSGHLKEGGEPAGSG